MTGMVPFDAQGPGRNSGPSPPNAALDHINTSDFVYTCRFFFTTGFTTRGERGGI